MRCKYCGGPRKALVHNRAEDCERWMERDGSYCAAPHEHHRFRWLPIKRNYDEASRPIGKGW